MRRLSDEDLSFRRAYTMNKTQSSELVKSWVENTGPSNLRHNDGGKELGSSSGGVRISPLKVVFSV